MKKLLIFTIFLLSGMWCQAQTSTDIRVVDDAYFNWGKITQFSLPTNVPTNGYVITSNGDGTSSWKVGGGGSGSPDSVKVVIAYYTTFPGNTISDGTTTITWNHGNNQTLNLTNDVIVTMLPTLGVSHYTLEVKHDATNTAYGITWGADVIWPTGLMYYPATTTDARDLITFFWDGTDFLAMGVNKFH